MGIGHIKLLYRACKEQGIAPVRADQAFGNALAWAPSREGRPLMTGCGVDRLLTLCLGSFWKVIVIAQIGEIGKLSKDVAGVGPTGTLS